ncbi:MAG: HAMP domain-containing sensor histidine kinase [Nitrospiraceae bacterium]|nr:HAMP domain-containing sensor histidine kinase [Nitrospiraceae bacterium]
MRNKLFLAFFLVISLALLSNFLFERLIIRDFGEYQKSTREDHIYWLIAAVENSFTNGGWDRKGLVDALHWAVMLRFECVVKDREGNVIMNSSDVLAHLSESMRRRMQIIESGAVVNTPYENYPLFNKGHEIGTFTVRDISSENSPLKRKEIAFRRRGRQFLLLSFLIAGGGALLLAVLFSQYLSRPVRELKKASEAVARGNLSVRLGGTGSDEIGRLKAAFNHMAESLQREDLLRRQLTSNVAHELRTPLAVMKARIEAMVDGVISTDQAGLEALQAELDSLTRLIRGIEDLTKAEASFFKKNPPEEVPLREYLGGIVEGMMPLFNEKGLYLKLAECAEMEVFTEPEKLEKVLRNIISNAWTHTASGGVTISCGRDGQARDGRFFIEITDTGKGISGEDLPLIFDRFYRGSGSRGFGLGLAIARELVDIMGGVISVKSRPGEGSVFRIVLPCGKAQ